MTIVDQSPTHAPIPATACGMCGGDGCYRCAYAGQQQHGRRAGRPQLRVLRYEPATRPADQAPTLAAPPQWCLIPVDPPVDPTARQRAHQVLRVALEVLDRRRPISQLSGHVEAAALRYLQATGTQLGPATRPSRLTSLRVCQPHRDAAEVAAVCRLRGRPRAIAARFDLLGTGPAGWRCTVLRIG
ncbi:Rv3235 family protein [Pseudonocardia acidicola]|uniref:Uncharacterized protein n=1 Tax=Pseudonocardia acidicola TaxID=2724939 RepID=A0ABX1S4R0_9PSEU|nr:Rv3235 family protein [Pseudonocardia acidicola]NMH96564.1 hypothetical protein [Pseudonocardia acidicola]